MNIKRPVPPREFGRDGITTVVDADRALRIREVGTQPTPPNQVRRSLRARLEGSSDNQRADSSEENTKQ